MKNITVYICLLFVLIVACQKELTLKEEVVAAAIKNSRPVIVSFNINSSNDKELSLLMEMMIARFKAKDIALFEVTPSQYPEIWGLYGKSGSSSIVLFEKGRVLIQGHGIDVFDSIDSALVNRNMSLPKKQELTP
ncbi:MAG: hypothetical protein OCD01_03560 [Fibrobacterales bacterium]